MTGWIWLEPDVYGGAGGNAFGKLMKASEFSAAALLAREVIQNSWDAAQEYRKVDPSHEFKMVFRFEKLTNFELKSRRRALAAEDIRENVLASDIKDKDKEPVKTGFLSEETEGVVLYIDDFGAHGLGGHPKLDKDSHLFKALYAFGITSNSKDDDGGGGSYGFGKSAFIRASRSHTVVAYTCFDGQPGDSVTRRLVGWSWWEGHTVSNKGLTRRHQGRAIFGVASHLSSSGIPNVEPYEDRAADALADELGIGARKPGNRLTNGTTLMLLDPAVTAEQILKEIETYWWPALVDNLMTISVIDEDGKEHHPKPRQREDLRSFIRAYELATSPADAKLPINEFKSLVKFKAFEDLKKEYVGEVAGVAIDADLDALTDEEFIPTVALIRGPRMVIRYYRKFHRKKFPIKAAFVTDINNHHVNSLLRDTEPPSHDVWDQEPSEDIASDATRLAKFVMKEISDSVNRFASALQPPVDHSGRRVKLFSTLLGQLLGESGGTTVPPGERFNVSIKYGKKSLELVDNDGISLSQSIVFTPGASAFGKSASGQISLLVSLNVIEDESKVGELIPLTVKVGNKVVAVDSKGRFEIEAEAEKQIEVKVKSASYNHKWTTRIKAEVLGVEPNGGKK